MWFDSFLDIWGNLTYSPVGVWNGNDSRAYRGVDWWLAVGGARETARWCCNCPLGSRFSLLALIKQFLHSTTMLGQFIWLWYILHSQTRPSLVLTGFMPILQGYNPYKNQSLLYSSENIQTYWVFTNIVNKVMTWLAHWRSYTCFLLISKCWNSNGNDDEKNERKSAK